MGKQELIKLFIQEARTYINAPFQHQGRTHNGIDCVGIIICSARKVGIECPNIIGYTVSPNAKHMWSLLNQYMSCIDVKNTKIGDILFMCANEIRIPQHLAIRTDKGILHAHSGIGAARGSKITTGKTVEHSFDDFWISKHMATFRFREFM